MATARPGDWWTGVHGSPMTAAMSDSVMRLIPADPAYVPDSAAQQRARTFLREALPEADRIASTVSEETRFLDPGENFTTVFCPACGTDLGTWWHQVMDRAFAAQFTDLAVVTPCCGFPTSLNDLRYDMPAGFGRFSLEALNPKVSQLPAEQQTRLEQLLGCRLRLIWARY